MVKESYHHGNLENDLIEAGLKLLSEKGEEGFSLRKVASACGVSHAAPYKHFKDMEALLNAMQDYVSENFADALTKALELYKDDEDKMVYFGQSYLNFFLENPHYFHFFIRQDHSEIDLSDINKKSSHKPFEIFRVAVLEEFNKHNVPESVRSKTLIRIWGIVHGVTMLSVMQNVEYDGNWSELLRELLKMDR